MNSQVLFAISKDSMLVGCQLPHLMLIVSSHQMYISQAKSYLSLFSYTIVR